MVLLILESRRGRGEGFRMVKSVCQVSREDPTTLPRVSFLLQSSLASGLTIRFSVLL